MWTSKIFPDDKLDGGLVASMLGTSEPAPTAEESSVDQPANGHQQEQLERAMIIVRELQTARRLAIRMNRDPEPISQPYVDMLLRHCREWEAVA